MHFSSLLGALAAIAVTGVHKVAALQPIAIDSITLWNGWQHQNVTLATREVDLSPQTTEERSEELSNSTDFGALEPRGDRFDSWPGEKFDCKGSSVCRGRWMVAACDKAVAYIKHYDVYRAGYVTFSQSRNKNAGKRRMSRSFDTYLSSVFSLPINADFLLSIQPNDLGWEQRGLS
ncbi:MAG: hypothetical protein LQ351_004272 [Letrouitia transgressa]|nr:MAG: hypothetical protein LQ351_004272 [Letrouitia transgressa]